MARDEIRASFSAPFQRGGEWFTKASVTLKENNATPTTAIDVHACVDNTPHAPQRVTGSGVIEIPLGTRAEPYHVFFTAQLSGADCQTKPWCVTIPATAAPAAPTRIMTMAQIRRPDGILICFQLADDNGKPVHGVRHLRIEDPTDARGFVLVDTNADGGAEYLLTFRSGETERDFNVSLEGGMARILKTVYL